MRITVCIFTALLWGWFSPCGVRGQGAGICRMSGVGPSASCRGDSVAAAVHFPLSGRVKTDALLWGATIMNAAGELYITPRVSASLSLAWCPWFVSDRKAVRVLAVMPEGRWWPATAGEGHFFGVHFSLAWYNVKWNRYRYQDRGRPLLGAGVTYGYSFRLAPKWALELAVGAGYASMRYDRFHNVPNGRLADTRKTSWWGIDRASVSIGYLLAP